MDQIQEFVRNNKFLVLAIVAILVLMCYQHYIKYQAIDQLTQELSKFVETPNIGNHEGFRAFKSNSGFLRDGKYVIRGSRNQKFCTDDPNGIICNRDFPGPTEMFTIQHLSGNEYAIQGYRSGLWCSLTKTGLRCDSPTVGDWQVFKLHPLGGYKYGIKSNKNQKWCVASGYGLVCDIDSMYGWEFQEFEFLPIRYNNIR